MCIRDSTSFHDLTELDKKMGSPAATQNLLTLYRLFQGPIATTLDNQREPFLPVEPVTPGKNMYPRGTTKALLSTPSLSNKDELLAARTVVRVARANNLREDINRLLKYPALQTLHPNLLNSLQGLETLKRSYPVSYTHLRAHETPEHLVC